MRITTRIASAAGLLLMLSAEAAAQTRPGDECPTYLGIPLDHNDPRCRYTVRPDRPPPPPQVTVEVADPNKIRNRRRPPPNVLEYRIETAPGHQVPLYHISGQVLMQLPRNTAGIKVHELVDTVSGATWASSCVGATCGWINGVYLRPSRVASGAEQGEIYTVTGVPQGHLLYVYAQPDLSSRVITMIPNGANDVVYLGQTARHGNHVLALVSWRGVRGWSVAQYLRR